MEEEKRFSIDGADMPMFLRGFAALIGMPQDPEFVIPDDTLYAIECCLRYFADDLEQFTKTAWNESCELVQLKTKLEQAAN